MSEKIKFPSEEEQKITDAPDGYRNCTVCGLWLEEGKTHNHEADNENG